MPKNIVYLGNFSNEESDRTEEHITKSLEKLGHKVFPFEEKDFNVQKITSLIKEVKADLFLFHKGGDSFKVPVTELVRLLNSVTCKKAFWYFDKMWQGRDNWADTVIPYVDHAFITDGSYLRRRNFSNAHYLNQGIGEDSIPLGEKKEELASDIAFTGTRYGKRQEWVESLSAVYGDRFRVFNHSFGRELNDLCASVKIFVAPQFPQDAFYWSSRVYMTLGSGGFLIHPKLEGLKEEFSENELVTYRDGRELKEKIDYYLTHEEERKKIQKAGYEKVINNYTYDKRIESLMRTIYG